MSWRYTVGANEFMVKTIAVKHSVENNIPIHFHAPSQYEEHDLTSEPKQSLQELMISSAKKLRKKFKYLQLNYSGGLDSNLILQLFTDNDIHIDEIQCHKAGVPDADYEIDQFALPTLKSLSHKLKKTKITIIEPSLEDYLSYYTKGITQDKIAKGCVGFYSHIRIHRQTALLKQFDSPDVAVITGKEKPRIMKHGDHFYTYFLDGEIEPHPQFYNFFVDDVEINAKQTHLWLAHFRNNANSIDAVWESELLWNKTVGRPVNKPYPSKSLHLEQNDNFILHNGKKIYYLNEKENRALSYFSKHKPVVLDLFQNWNDSLVEYTRGTWWNHGLPEFGYVNCFSKFYGLTKKDVKTVDQLFPDGFNT